MKMLECSNYQKARPPKGLFGGTSPLGAKPLKHWGPPRVKVSRTEMGAWGPPCTPRLTGEIRPKPADKLVEKLLLNL